MNDYKQFLDYKYEQKLRNRRFSIKLDGYDADTIIMALDRYSKDLKYIIKRLIEGNSITVYSETVKRLYSAEFLKDRLMEQANKAILDEIKKDKKRYKEDENETK